MTVLGSAADAVRGAVAMQQAARRRAAGERLRLRVGLHAGEALRKETVNRTFAARLSAGTEFRDEIFGPSGSRTRRRLRALRAVDSALAPILGPRVLPPPESPFSLTPRRAPR